MTTLDVLEELATYDKTSRPVVRTQGAICLRRRLVTIGKDSSRQGSSGHAPTPRDATARRDLRRDVSSFAVEFISFFLSLTLALHPTLPDHQSGQS